MSASEDNRSIVAKRGDGLMEQSGFIQFKGKAMVLTYDPYPHYIPLHKSYFDKLAYTTYGGLTRGQISDLYAYVCSVAPDYTPHGNLLSFGYFHDDGEDVMEAGGISAHGIPTVWDMEAVDLRMDLSPSDCVWRSPYSRKALPQDESGKSLRLKFIMDLAGQDEAVYDDIMQSIAPLIMDKKPDGVIWWVGNGANGKSTLMDAIYRMFPGQLASLTVKRLVDGRDTPSLNGVLGNIVKESSEGRVEDTEIYKALGTHENFRVHKFHSQDDVEINGNIHSIFSANTIPSFNDKGFSARRRTFIIPFNQQFESDPDFERTTFTPEFFQHFAQELCRYAHQLQRQGLRYKWSGTTVAAKADYDAEASNAEEYVKELVDAGAVAFTDYAPVKYDYERWCLESGFVPLGLGNLRKAIKTYSFERVSRKMENGMVSKIYRLTSVSGDAALQPMGGAHAGIMTLAGFQPVKPTEPPETSKQTTILNGKW